MNPILTVVLGAAALNLYALVLVVLRGPVFATRVYRPMLLNIALSLAPALVLALVLGALLGAVALASPVAVWLVVVVGGLAWLLLLPNSAYLVTELNFSHRRDGEDVPLWFDIVLVLSLALSGVVNTLLNVLLVQVVLVAVAYPNDAAPLERASSWIVVVVVLALVTFGMYLGRYLRFNSWDVRHPGGMVRKLAGHFRERRNLAYAAGFCLTHTALLAIVYVLVMGPAVAVL